MVLIFGVIQLQGDIIKKLIVQEIIFYFEGEKVDLVVCDGVFDVIGFYDIDEYIQVQLFLVVLNIIIYVFRIGGIFVVKIFCGKDVILLYF